MLSTELMLLYLFMVNTNYKSNNIISKYRDYFNELREIIKRINLENPYYDFKKFKGRLLSEYLSLSIGRYKLCRDYVRFCETFVI